MWDIDASEISDYIIISCPQDELPNCCVGVVCKWLPAPSEL